MFEAGRDLCEKVWVLAPQPKHGANAHSRSKASRKFNLQIDLVAFKIPQPGFHVPRHPRKNQFDGGINCPREVVRIGCFFLAIDHR